MGKKCQICKKKCSGDILKADGDKYFHIDCFKCKACGDSLTDTGFYTTPDGSYLCPTHYRTISTPLTIHADLPPKSKSISKEQISGPSSPTVCAACGDHLHSGQVLLALNQSWHVWCFKCSECDTVLQGEYMAHENRPLCLRDYNLKYGVKCYECQRYIGGKVLQAGNYKFHPTCARCTRCGNHFGDGQEMFIQGNEIWHSSCDNFPTENLALTKSPSRMSQPKYSLHLGQHQTYMYLLPEASQTYLKQPISPHPPAPAQYHTPKVPIKIRKSRLATLKTGMQRLTEDLDKNATPRAKSPHMDNEEPIELAHFPGAHEPDPNEVPPIERENFPAPPYTKFEGIEDYPYAIEEMKRRLSSSSVENDSSDEEDYGDQTKVDVEKIKRNVQALEKLDNDSSIAHILRQNIEESKNKNPLKLHWDPRNASRTPSAKKMPHLRFRYDTPINASPSRHLNRPKPWAIWPDGQDHRSATTVIPSFHVPNGTLNSRAATLPEGYYYAGMDGTLNSHYSDHSLNASTLNDSGHVRTGGDIRTNLRTSLPDLNKPVKTYPLDKLQTDNKKLPEDVDRQHLERHLAREDFESLFEMEPIEGCDFSTLYSRSKSHHIHKSCPVCSKPFVAKPYYDNCVSSHPAQQDGYSRALIQRYEDDLKVLKRGKKLFKKVNEHFIDETKNRICYLYFIMEPLTVRPTTLKAFVQAIRYVGKGQGNRIVEHGFCELSRSCQGVIDFITSCRSKGERPIGFKVKVDMANKEAGVYEKAVLQTIGHWNLLNEKGEGVIGDLDDWSVEDDAVFGSHILAEAFKEFTKTPIDKHWRYLLEHVKQSQSAAVKAKAAQHADSQLESISGREIKANLLKKSTLNHRIADNDEFVKIPENVNKDQIKQLFSLIKDGRVDNAMLSQFISSLPSTSNGDAHRKRRQDFVETDEPAIKKKR